MGMDRASFMGVCSWDCVVSVLVRLHLECACEIVLVGQAARCHLIAHVVVGVTSSPHVVVTYLSFKRVVRTPYTKGPLAQSGTTRTKNTRHVKEGEKHPCEQK